MSPELCIVLAFVLFGLAWYVQDWLTAFTLTRYGRQAENLYVYSKHPRDRSVYRRAQAHQQMLDKAENDLRVEIHMIVFQEGEHVNENWGQFQQRVRDFIAEDRVKRHKWLRENRRMWYLREVVGLTGIEIDQV